ncbi:MAG: DUF1015 domain-containing protein [Oscillospiraceae bacterium]|nr:DUF1015 domain-containing protein [Oscillospiraceae bacterium]
MAIFQRADLLIPQLRYLPHWPVIACDQFTSQPDYWRNVKEAVGTSPSAYHIIFPEAELGEDETARIEQIDRTMEKYLASDVFRLFPQSYVYVERTLRSGAVRRGLIGVIDLDSYDYRDEARSPVRATERTVVSRIPPRVKIRAGAALESSHVLLLCSDPERKLIETVEKGEKLYDLELMQGGGRVAGWLVDGERADRFDRALAEYVSKAENGFCFAVGDGNHSLAAAKTCWEKKKADDPTLAGTEHPARYAMVELENLFDPVQDFEPIHRIVRGVNPAQLLKTLAQESERSGTPILWYTRTGGGIIRFGNERLPLEALQSALDDYLASKGGSVDYIHGEDVALKLAREEGAIAFLLPRIEKEELFRTIARGGALPRKTFSVGSAEEKRYYLECRQIR